MMNDKPVGLTQDQGWEIGVRQTISVAPEHAWALLTSPSGLAVWLGDDADVKFAKGELFETKDGGKGRIVSYTDGSLIRMRWQPPEWDFESTLQLRVIAAKTWTTISIHQERLQNADQREAMRKHWQAVLEKLERLAEEENA